MADFPRPSPDKARLFAAYARFEFALKECDYVIPRAGPAYADWPRFAGEACLSDVLDKARLNPDVQELLVGPPQVQMTSGNRKWHWEDKIAAPIQDLATLFKAVKQVRDNLFHGGKSGEDKRDDALCRAGLLIIDLCLERHRELRDYFEYKY